MKKKVDGNTENANGNTENAALENCGTEKKQAGKCRPNTNWVEYAGPETAVKEVSCDIYFCYARLQ